VLNFLHILSSVGFVAACAFCVVQSVLYHNAFFRDEEDPSFWRLLSTRLPLLSGVDIPAHANIMRRRVLWSLLACAAFWTLSILTEN